MYALVVACVSGMAALDVINCMCMNDGKKMKLVFQLYRDHGLMISIFIAASSSLLG